MYSLIISKFPGVVGVGVTVKGSLCRSDNAKVSDLHPVGDWVERRVKSVMSE